MSLPAASPAAPRIPRPALLAILCLLVLLTRLPFLGNGYGLHADNWRIALAARHIAATGAYEASRLPGYPVQEYICSLFWKTGPFGFNLLDALFCTAASFFFALICIEYAIADWFLAALALSFVPVLYVNSVSSKDFPWALALLLAAWWCAMRKKPILTGIALGLAIGCRITSGAAALPIALILIDDAGNRLALRRLLITASISALVALIAFTPVYARYGTDFFNFYAEHAFPTPVQILKRMTLEVWDILGLLGLAIAAISAFARNLRPPISSRHLTAWLSMLIIYAIAFICLPDEAAYLIPAIPFTLLLAWWLAPPWPFRVCCLLMIASPFLSAITPLAPAGQILQDRHDRISTDDQINGFLRFSTQVSGSNAYIVGSWQPPIDLLTADSPHPTTKYLYLLSQPELDQLSSQGWHVWYLPLMREFNYRVYNYDVAAHGARDVRLLKPDLPPAGSDPLIQHSPSRHTSFPLCYL
jgi:hypothetical protein